MDVNKLDFGYIRDLKKVLKMPKTDMEYIGPSELKEMLGEVKKIVTVHLYPFSYHRRKEKCLLDMERWSYHQIYLFVHENKIFWTFGHGDTSQARADHNNLIEIFLNDEEARKKVITAVLCIWNREILSYYFYPGFSYSNMDVGSNWGLEIRDNVKKSKIPYSFYRTSDIHPTKTLYFANGRRTTQICHLLHEDLAHRRFISLIRKMSKENSKVVL